MSNVTLTFSFTDAEACAAFLARVAPTGAGMLTNKPVEVKAEPAKVKPEPKKEAAAQVEKPASSPAQPAAKEAESAKTEPTSSQPAAASDDTAARPTYDDVKKAVLAMAKISGDKALATLKSFTGQNGEPCDHGTKLKLEDYPAFLAAAAKVLDEVKA